MNLEISDRRQCCLFNGRRCPQVFERGVSMLKILFRVHLCTKSLESVETPELEAPMTRLLRIQLA